MERISALLDELGWCWCMKKRPSIYGINTKVPIFCVMGPELCRKTEIAILLSRKVDFEYIHAMDFVHEYLPYEDDDLILQICEAINSKKHFAKGFVIDGFPRNLYQMRMFTKECYEPRILLLLTLDDAEVVRRSQSVPGIALEEFINDLKPYNDIYNRYETKTVKFNDNMKPEVLVNRLTMYLELYYGFVFNSKYRILP